MRIVEWLDVHRSAECGQLASHLVQAERRGREIAYSLTDEHVAHIAHIAHDAVVHATERELHR